MTALKERQVVDKEKVQDTGVEPLRISVLRNDFKKLINVSNKVKDK